MLGQLLVPFLTWMLLSGAFEQSRLNLDVQAPASGASLAIFFNTVAGVGCIKMDAVTKGVMLFMLAEFAVMFLMMLFPGLVTVPARWFSG